jgi:hypothetical protein
MDGTLERRACGDLHDAGHGARQLRQKRDIDVLAAGRPELHELHDQSDLGVP